MKLKIKKTGNIIRVREDVWESLKVQGIDNRYEVVDPTPQPRMQPVARPQPKVIYPDAYSEALKEPKDSPRAEKKKRRAKKKEVVIEDVTKEKHEPKNTDSDE